MTPTAVRPSVPSMNGATMTGPSMNGWKEPQLMSRAAGESATSTFGADVFTERVMQSRLPKDVFKRLQRTINQGEPLDHDVADIVASAMKDWAVENGASHYTHWFQPLTGLTAEKHDAFLVPDGHPYGRTPRTAPTGRSAVWRHPRRRVSTAHRGAVVQPGPGPPLGRPASRTSVRSAR